MVVDTNVFSAVLGSDPMALFGSYQRYLSGKAILISFQTAAEVRYGALAAGWGAKRTAQLELKLSRAVLVPPHEGLIIEAAQLRHDCRKAGHGLQAGNHAGDLWIAATARLGGVPLVTHDSIFDGTPGLTVIRES